MFVTQLQLHSVSLLPHFLQCNAGSPSLSHFLQCDIGQLLPLRNKNYEQCVEAC